VEAEIPVPWVGDDGGVHVALSMATRYARREGRKLDRDVDFEDRIKRPLPASSVRAIHLHPEPEFMRLSGMSEWR
jgi:hypothetical protein